jgi:outer membrane protein assembly factor BamD (BamD/ComL family)
MNTKSLLFAALLVALSAGSALCAESPLNDNAAAKSKEDALYSEGTRDINDARWAQAEAIFTNIAEQHGARAEAALYWKAYAENKQGNATRAIETCSQLRQAYPH